MSHVEPAASLNWAHEFQPATPVQRPANMNELAKLIVNGPMFGVGSTQPSTLGASPNSAFSQPSPSSGFPSPLLLAALAQHGQQMSPAHPPPTPTAAQQQFPLDFARIQQQLQLQQAQQLLLQQILATQHTNGSRSAPASATAFTPFQPPPNAAQLAQPQKPGYGILNPLLASLKHPGFAPTSAALQMPPPRVIPAKALRKQASSGLIEPGIASLRKMLNPTGEVAAVAGPSTTTELRTPASRSRSSSGSGSGSAASPEAWEMGRLPQSSYYPTHFMKGTIIELADGRTKKVEDMSSDDFLRCAETSAYLTMETSRVDRVDTLGPLVRVRFLVGDDGAECIQDYQPEHPFFVVAHGWSSHDPAKTKNTYGLDTRRLAVGDICISLTRRPEDVNGGALDDAVTITAARRFADEDAEQRATKRRHSLSDESTSGDSGDRHDVVSGGSSSSGSSPLQKKDEDDEGAANKKHRSDEIDVSA